MDIITHAEASGKTPVRGQISGSFLNQELVTEHAVEMAEGGLTSPMLVGELALAGVDVRRRTIRSSEARQPGKY